jgi:hypothetical protein
VEHERLLKKKRKRASERKREGLGIEAAGRERKSREIYIFNYKKNVKKFIYIYVKCKAITKIYIFNPVPGNPVKTRYQKPGAETGVPGFWFFQTRTGTGTPVSGFSIFRFPGFGSGFPIFLTPLAIPFECNIVF